MNVKNKLVVGISIFAMLSMFFAPFFSQKVYAAPATSKAQLDTLAKNLKFKDKDTIEGKIGNTTVTFNKTVEKDNPTTSVTGIPVVIYKSTELACENIDAIVRNGYLTDSSSLFLLAAYKDGDKCSQPQSIKVSTVSQEDFNKNTEEDRKVNQQGNGDNDNEKEPSCDAQLSSIISWVLCPIIDGSLGATHFMFENIISPFLEDVPITTDPEDGSYRAWKNFRLLGNIVLVGTMMAVVYAQVKGGR